MKRFATVLLALTAASCATSRPADRSSLLELSRMRAQGTLAEVRLQCITMAIPSAVDDWVATLPERRELRAEAERGAIEAHARSVQEGMAHADQTTQARQASMTLLRASAQAHAEGDALRAAQLADYADGVRRDAERPPTLVRRSGAAAGGAGPGYGIPEWTPLLSDEDGARLSRYAHLRAAAVAAPLAAEGPLGEARALESEDADLDARYATLLLDAYLDADVSCVSGG